MSERRPNIVLVTVDCLRRDRLSAYGYERPTTPFLDELLEGALHAPSAHAASSWTCPSVVSLLTGLYPSRHGGGLVPGSMKNLSERNLPTLFDRAIPSLPVSLRSAGYADAAFGAVWNAHLAIPGLFQEMRMLERPASTLVARALGWIRRQDRPFFLWLHLGDTHEPLRVPLGGRNAFGRVPRLRNVRRWSFTKADDPVGTPAFDRYRDARIRLYDAAVRGVDRSLRTLWEELARTGEGDGTILVVTSDHGEEFWEHRADELAGFIDPRNVYGTGHGHNLFQVHVLVPLVVVGPDVPVGAIPGNVSLVDLAPTLWEMAGVDPPATDGRSLLDRGPDRPILSEAVAYGHEKRSVVQGDLKLLSAPEDGFERLSRLGPDRRESRVADDPAALDRLRAALPAAVPVQGDQVDATTEIVEHLRDLGYIE